MTLLELAKQYKSDVETRIKCIEEERDNDEAAQNDAEYYDDYTDQLAHWNTTLWQIQNCIKENS